MKLKGDREEAASIHPLPVPSVYLPVENAGRWLAEAKFR